MCYLWDGFSIRFSFNFATRLLFLCIGYNLLADKTNAHSLTSISQAYVHSMFLLTNKYTNFPDIYKQLIKELITSLSRTSPTESMNAYL